MGIATLIASVMFVSCNAQTDAESIEVNDTNTSMNWCLKDDPNSRELLFNYDYVEDIYFVANTEDSTILYVVVNYWDADILDADYLQYRGYECDLDDPHISLYIDPEDIDAFVACYEAYQKATYLDQEKINDCWRILASDDDQYYQIVPNEPLD